MDLSDDDYDHVSDIDMCSDSDEEFPSRPHESAPSSPPSVRNASSSGRKQHDCPYENCQKTFNRKARLDEHIRSHLNVRLFKCRFTGCDKEYLRQSHLNHHTKTSHSDIRDYKCTWSGCDKSFATGTRLRRHLQAHEGREKFRCRGYDGCNETFRKHETLKKHILSVHENVQPHACASIDSRTGKPCVKAFDTMAKLKAHQQAMHDATRFSCADCLATAPPTAITNGHVSKDASTQHAFFATYSELQAHIAEIHPPTCQYCPTSFTTLKELNRHLELQHGWVDPNLPKDATYPCTFADCDRTFTKKGNLNVHIRTVHQKRKDFVCGVTLIPVPEELAGKQGIEVFGCGREFTSKATLEDHVRSAHFGLESKLVERRKKRKADMAASRETNGEREAPRLKKTRKDKGVKKTSAFAGLTGRSASQDISAHLTDTPRRIKSSNPFVDESTAPELEPVKREDEGVQDEFDTLSGSTVLFGNHLYHNGQEYSFKDGRFPDDSSSMPPFNERNGFDDDDDDDYAFDPKRVNYLTALEDEPVFDNFEHEPEFMNGLHIDPVLL